MVELEAFRDGMALLGSAVSVITTNGAAGRAGFTATAVCSVTDQPPTLLVCVNRSSYVHRFFAENRVMCVNLLGGHQEAVSGRFANRALDMEARFAAAEWEVSHTGAPVLADALATFDCRIVDAHEVGTHTVFYGAVAGVRRQPVPRSLVYFNRAYHALGADEVSA